MMDPIPVQSGVGGLLALFHHAEQALGVRITVHDRVGLLHGPDGVPLLPGDRTMHAHAFCQRDRLSRLGWDARCRAHCLEQVNAAVLAQRGPLRHRCWKGASEVVVPVFRGGRHVLTLFAGVYRGEPSLDLGDLATVEAQQALPALAEDRAIAIASVLAGLGDGVVAQAEALGAEPEAHDRAGRIRHLLRSLVADGQTPVLRDVARLLGVSPSRAAHVVSQVCGGSFRELVAAERLARAKRLLITTNLSAHAVATEVGYEGPHHFSRAFRAGTGLPPGQWRALHSPQG